jgi:DNA primase
MARYTDDSRERVRGRRSTSPSSSARRTGSCGRPGQRRLTGLCPFHDERTPSFGIDPVEKLYHCFGCGAGGDVFKFVMETEGLDFGGAPWSRSPRARGSSSSASARIRATPSAAAAPSGCSRCSSARRLLRARAVGVAEAGAAREYLAGRGLEEATLREFRVGWSSAAWDRVLSPRAGGYTEAELHAAGRHAPPRRPRRLRPLPRPHHVPAGRRARARARLRARALGDGRRRST